MIKTLPYKHVLLLVRILAISLVVLVIFFLVKRDIAFSGKFFVSHDYLSPSPFYTELVPKQRIQSTEDGVRLLDEPVYTTFRYPRPFQQAEVNVSFKNPDDLFAEFGPQVDLPEIYDRYGLNHPALNQLLQDDSWLHTDVQLYQRSSADYRFESLDQFWSSLPDQQRTGYYGVDWKSPYIPENLELNDSRLIMDTPLRGRHTFLSAIPEGDASFVFTLQDLDAKVDGEEVTIMVEDFNGEHISTYPLGIEGNENGGVSKSVTVEINVSSSIAKVIRIRLSASDDIVLHSVESNINHFVAEERIHLAGGPDYVSEFGDDRINTVELTSSSRKWAAQTMHRTTLQTLRMARERINLNEPYNTVVYTMPASERFVIENGYPIFVEKGNIVIQGKGVFAVDPESYFSPYPWLIDSTVNSEALGLSYLVTDYQMPVVSEDGVVTQTYAIDLSKVFAPNKALRFQLSLPEMKDQASFQLVSVSTDYTSDPITISNFFEKLKRFIDRELLSYE